MTEGEQRRGWSGAAWVPQLATALVVAAILWVAYRDRSGAAASRPAPGMAAVEPASALDAAAPLGPAEPRPDPGGPVEQDPLVVRVIDEGGAPLSGVVVEVSAPDPRSGEALLQATRTSGGDGLATFEGLRDELAELPGARRLVVAFPGTDAPLGRLVFPVGAVPPRPLVLVHQGRPEPGPALPGTAALEVSPTAEPGVELGAEPARPDPRDVAAAEPEPDSPDSSEDPAVADLAGGPDLSGGSSAPGKSNTPDGPAASDAPGSSQAAASTQQPAAGPDAGAAPELPAAVALAPGVVVGRLLLDPDVPAGALRLELDEVLPSAPGFEGRRLGPLAPDPDGSFRFDGVAPGLVALRVSLLGTRRTLLWVDELEVEPGAELRDPRLWSELPADELPASLPGLGVGLGGGVDLRGRLFPFHVELLDEFGQRLEQAVVLPLDRATGVRGLLQLQSEGRTPRLWGDRRVLEGRAELDLLLVAPDRQVRQVSLSGERLGGGRARERGLEPLAQGTQALSFELGPGRARPVELRLVGWPGGPGVVLEPRYAAGLRLEARLERVDGLRFPWDHERHRGSFDERGRLRLTPADPGAFVVRLAWIDPADPSGPGTDLDLAVPIEVGVDRGDPAAGPRDVVFLPIGRSGL